MGEQQRLIRRAGGPATLAQSCADSFVASFSMYRASWGICRVPNKWPIRAAMEQQMGEGRRRLWNQRLRSVSLG